GSEIMPKKQQPLWKASKSALQNAKLVLPGLAAKYLKASRKLASGKAPAKAFHKFRLRTKRFRYTLELFRPCYGPSLEPRLNALRQVQRHLGEINDYSTALRLIGGNGKRRSKELAGLFNSLETRIAKNTADLGGKLQGALRLIECKRWWLDYLARPPAK